MPEVARKDEKDTVDSPDGDGEFCKYPTIQATKAGSDNVFVNSIGVVRLGDAMTSHTSPGCEKHAPPLTSGSATVFANGRNLGRNGDAYGGDHIITSGSPNVFAGG